ncbi:Hypothetical predicted protein [Podarcis lilfordi]|uniref:Uncharacterized protein n=1 Tax=Podarcis lilfordi TaxID=74358 RepID=A0AA35KHJ5_9SAUR|nr:Hypothetical predicted protein [Podarcis lilfordi]
MSDAVYAAKLPLPPPQAADCEPPYPLHILVIIKGTAGLQKSSQRITQQPEGTGALELSSLPGVKSLRPSSIPS